MRWFWGRVPALQGRLRNTVLLMFLPAWEREQLYSGWYFRILKFVTTRNLACRAMGQVNGWLLNEFQDWQYGFCDVDYKSCTLNWNTCLKLRHSISAQMWRCLSSLTWDFCSAMGHLAVSCLYCRNNRSAKSETSCEITRICSLQLLGIEF
jgi:hypothetical protein